MSASKWKRPSATNTMASCSPCSRGAVQPSTSPGDSGRACTRIGARKAWKLSIAPTEALAVTVSGCLLLCVCTGCSQIGCQALHSAHLRHRQMWVVRQQRLPRGLQARGKLDGACQHQPRAGRKVEPAGWKFKRCISAECRWHSPERRCLQGHQHILYILSTTARAPSTVTRGTHPYAPYRSSEVLGVHFDVHKHVHAGQAGDVHRNKAAAGGGWRRGG